MRVRMRGTCFQTVWEENPSLKLLLPEPQQYGRYRGTTAQWNNITKTQCKYLICAVEKTLDWSASWPNDRWKHQVRRDMRHFLKQNQLP
jgi:hypothetical protein